MEYTILKSPDGKLMKCRCSECSIKEFFGFCENCWIRLKPQDRAALMGKELPTVEVTVRHPDRITIMGLFGFVWKVAVTAAILFLLYRQGYLDHTIKYLTTPRW